MKKYETIIVIFIFYNCLEANDNLNVKTGVKNILLNGVGTIYSYPKQCTVALDEFAQGAADFTLCSITKARPIRLCEKCIDEYMNFTNKYQEMLDTVVNGTSCRSYLLSQDRFDVISEYHDHIMTVWDKGHCNDCFEFSNGTHRLSNKTMRFNKMAQDTIDCITINLDPSRNNTEEVCIACMEIYLDLNEVYKSLSKDSIGVDSVCMDTVDLMNTTRSIWSKNLNCCKMRKSPEVIFLCSAAIISLLPFMYYIVVRYYGPIKDLPKVLKESRFKQSIQSRINENTKEQ